MYVFIAALVLYAIILLVKYFFKNEKDKNLLAFIEEESFCIKKFKLIFGRSERNHDYLENSSHSTTFDSSVRDSDSFLKINRQMAKIERCGVMYSI